ncbi:bifunctional [glutamine synthetase] adenylyltransferase/[glutamine synthetase]-adenylyl-L-tyrosine phosphorylase [Mycobacterium sp. LTG2003]
MPKPATERPKLPSVGRLGLVDSQANAHLDRLGWNTESHVELLWSLSRAPDADVALLAMVRLAEALGGEWDELNRELLTDRALRGRLFGVLGSSLALGDHLVAHPRSWRLLVGRAALPSAEELRDAFTSAAHRLDIDRGTSAAVPPMRDLYRDRLLVLAALDVASTVENEPVVPFVTVSTHLSDLADAALGAALTVATRAVCGDGAGEASRLAVIAMGKCGARELNYVSDVDVIFVGEDVANDNLTTATRVAGEMMRFAADAFFEVDAALRPEGKRGQLVRTLDSHVAYYQRWAKTWEFQALLKARPAAGDPDLGKAYIDALMPMVWTACEREDFVPEVQAMRRRVEELVPAGVRSREIKLGTGGLRDVEFAVQLLQLVHGRNDDSLHVASTVDALAALGAGGYIGRDDTANMTASYEFLRLLEHRLQLQRLKRTHMLPDDSDEEAFRWLARAAHIRPDGTHDASGVLREELKRQSLRVSRLHAKLFYQPLLESVGQPALGIEAGMSPEAAERQLAALGYEGPQSALTHLAALTGTTGRKGRVQQVLLPTLLDWLSDTPDPDAGLLAYRRISDELQEQRWYLSTLRDEGAVAKRLMRVLGTSAYIPELLMRAPEVIQLYADGPNGPKLLEGDPDSVARSLVASAGRHADPVRGIAAARTLRRRELARIASADVLGMLEVTEVCKALTSVWVAVLQAALNAVIRANTPESGVPARIAVIGMGRLGGGELGYGSDADVMFVCEPVPGAEESVAVRWAVSIAEQVRALLGTPSADPPLEVDAGLRPEGRNGPLVRTLASYEAYYAQWAQPWEIQALLRAHRVAGDLELGERFLLMADRTRYPSGGVSAEAVHEIRRIKARVDAERLPRGADPNTHTKLGRGGLADIEWTVQLLQLRYAHKVPALHNTSTLETLNAIGAAELVAESDVELLRDAWLTATRARNALVLVRGKPTDQLPGPGRQLNAVALAAGWGSDDGGEFLDNYLRVTRRAKAVVRKVFGG